jgi:hypothetical protein
MRYLNLGRSVFGISIAALGLQHFFIDHVIVSRPFPGSFLGALFQFVGLFYDIGLITLGSAILFTYRIKAAAFGLGLLIFGWALFRHLPLVIANFADPGEINSLFMALAISGGSFIISNSIQPDSYFYRLYPLVDQKRVKLVGSSFYGISVFVFGIQHILYASFIASLIPGWIPGNHFWAYTTGIALIGSGASIVLGWKSKYSASCVGAMIFLWIPLVHFPRIHSNPGNHYEWTSFLQASIIATSAFVLYVILSTKEGRYKSKELTKMSKSKRRWHQRNPRLKESQVQ